MIRFTISLILLLLAAPQGASAAPRVVTSIKPVHALVAGVMKDVGTPATLIPGGGSVHSYSLRPSDAAALDTAEVIFWIGPGFEKFLEKPIGTLGRRAKVVSLMMASGVTRRTPREGGLWEAHEAERHDHDNHKADGHIWLDPVNAKAMVAAISSTLSGLDSANATRYAANASALRTRIDTLDAEIKTAVAAVRDKPFIVFHDAYQYFEKAYGLGAVGSIAVAPDRPPGARRISAIKNKVAAHGVVCVFAEPQFEPKLARMLIEGTSARIGTLDPEGSVLPAGEDAYFTLMRNLARDLKSCLSGQIIR